MKYLVDTHVLIWAVLDSERLSEKARHLLLDTTAEHYFSPVSVWEIAIKRAKNPDLLPFSADTARDLFLAAGFAELEIAATACAAVETLPPIHADPFDRLLVAQAKTAGMTLLTHDRLLAPYGDFILKV